MTHRNDSSSHHRDNSEHSSSSHQRVSYNTSLSLNLLQANQDNSTHYYDRTQTPSNSTNYYDRTQTPSYSTNYYDRTQTPSDQTPVTDLSTQAALDCWAPRRSIRANDYRDPENFSNPYNDLDAANQINRTQGFNAARSTYLRSIQDADGIDLTNVKQDHNYDVQNLNRINSRESNLSRYGGSFEDMQNLEQQKHQILNNETELKNLYYAPANTRISMGIACIKTGDPMEMLEGQRLIEEAKQKRPEIAEDPRLQQMIDRAYQVGYRAHNNSGRPANSYEYQPGSSNNGVPEYQRTDTPEYQPARTEQTTPRQTTVPPHDTPFAPERTTQPPAPWHPGYEVRPSIPVPNPELPSRTTPVPTPSYPELQPRTTTVPTPEYPELPPRTTPVSTPSNPELPPRVHAEIPPPAVIPNDRPAITHPTVALVQSSQTRVSDTEALNWMHSRYQHLTVESLVQVTREAQQAYQQAFDNTGRSFNPYSDSREERGKVAGESARADKMIEFGKARNAELANLFATSSQPHSADSDLARQALITTIKNSAGNMSNEAQARQISEECCEQVKKLCQPNANGRSEMIDAVRIGLTESSHLSGGGKNYLIDGLESLASDQSPAISRETAGRIALLALKHDVENTPRLGAPDRPGESRGECIQRQIRLIGMIDKFGFKSAKTDLQDLLNSNASDEVRQAAQQALADLQKAS